MTRALLGVSSRPCIGNSLAPDRIVDYQNELVGVIAVDDFNVHARIRHKPSYLPQLTRLYLIQPLNEHLAIIQNFNPSVLECSPGSSAVLKQEVRDSLAVDQKRSASFDADTRFAQRLTHLGESARPVLQSNRQIPHAYKLSFACILSIPVGEFNSR